MASVCYKTRGNQLEFEIKYRFWKVELSLKITYINNTILNNFEQQIVKIAENI